MGDKNLSLNGHGPRVLEFSEMVHVAISAPPNFPLTIILNRMNDFAGQFVTSLTMQLPPPAVAIPGARHTPQFMSIHIVKVNKKRFEKEIAEYNDRSVYPIEQICKEAAVPTTPSNSQN